MTIFLFKLVLTPLLIVLATLAARRWGPVAGGWIVALPLTSGPVSVFIALEQGADFAAAAAASTVLGCFALMAFSLTYEYAATRFSWTIAMPLALGAFFLAVTLLQYVHIPPLLSTALVIVCSYAALALTRSKTAGTLVLHSPRWDLPFRMFAATAMVLLVTTLSSRLGPALSGLLAAFPTFICVMTVFSHKLGGADSARQMARGVILGLFSFAPFFLVVALTVPRLNFVLVYLLACLASIAVNIFILILLKRGKKHAG